VSDPAAPQELPPAYVPPAYIAPASALDQPGLGLVLAFAALFALPQAAMLLAQTLLLDLGDGKMIALAGLMAGGVLLQLAAGIAVAWQSRVRAPLFFASVACGASLMMFVFTLWSDELPVRAATVMAIETLGGPLLVVLAPRLFGLRRRGGGGPSLRYELGQSDLLVMGGACQRTWQHAVPKVAHAEPRLAVMFRPIWTPPDRRPASR